MTSRCGAGAQAPSGPPWTSTIAGNGPWSAVPAGEAIQTSSDHRDQAPRSAHLGHLEGVLPSRPEGRAGLPCRRVGAGAEVERPHVHRVRVERPERRDQPVPCHRDRVGHDVAPDGPFVLDRLAGGRVDREDVRVRAAAVVIGQRSCVVEPERPSGRNETALRSVSSQRHRSIQSGQRPRLPSAVGRAQDNGRALVVDGIGSDMRRWIQRHWRYRTGESPSRGRQDYAAGGRRLARDVDPRRRRGGPARAPVAREEHRPAVREPAM